jgi:hypothetical protein
MLGMPLTPAVETDYGEIVERPNRAYRGARPTASWNVEAANLEASGRRMAVLHGRDTLIAWYERRGYVVTGEQEPFPYGDDRFGQPLGMTCNFLGLEKEMDYA